ncbi:YidC/Oxa1 family membrane protein insertase [Patescibacteria group bacterium]|nr:YidC/Oxa1 family membrane protein insertase [Patescibacteria group bacterium]
MFEFLVTLFDTLLYQPLFNFLVVLYKYIPGRDFGLAVILLTVSIRLILYSSSAKSIRNQRILSEIQPKLQEIQKTYKDDKEKLVKETMALYKEAKINPIGGLAPALVQLPVLIALYRVFWRGFEQVELGRLYGFIPSPGAIDAISLGFIDLSKPNLIIAVLAGIFQFIQTRLSMETNKKPAKNDFAKVMQKQMIYFFPVITVLILMTMPSALGVYWVTGSIFLIIQQKVVLKKQHG